MNIMEKQAGAAVTVLSLNGRLDANSSETLEARFAQLFEQGRRAFVFDFGGIEYVSSAGLRSVLIAGKKVKAGQGKLALCRMNELVKEVFDMSGFSKIFAIYATEEEALRAVE
jgi:anti-sigma B factor antagonist